MATITPATGAPGSPVVTLTPSQADIFDRCPWQYGARYVQRLVPDAWPPTPYTAMGDSVHACLCHFHRRGGHPRYARDDMAGLLDQSWRRDGYADAEQEVAARAMAGRLCAAYYAASRDEPTRHLGHELFLAAEFRLAGVHLRVRGKVDRLSLWPDGRLEVLDYKTGTRVPSEADLADALSPFLYLLLVRRTYPTYDRVEVSHLYLREMARVTVAYDHDRCMACKDRLAQVVTQIARGTLPPHPNAFCPSCPVHDRCPAMDPAAVELDDLLQGIGPAITRPARSEAPGAA